MSGEPSPQSLEMIARLIAFPTVSRDSNLDLIHWVAEYLDGFGIDSELVHDESGTKANLFATIGPSDRGGVLLSGHTDVVPIDGQEWQSDPFATLQRDGRLYGRGTCDMKSFVAIALAMVPDFLAKPLKTPVHFAFSYDEEVGCLGVRRLLAILKDAPVKPASCIVGEPTGMQVIKAHKGKVSYRCEVRGFECHSSIAHTGVNAVEAASELVAMMKAMARARSSQGPFDAAFDPPYTTIHTGTIQGGTALNIVPKDCSFDFEFRYVPGDSPEAILAAIEAYARNRLEPEMQAVQRDTWIRFSPLSSFPGLDTPEEAEITVLAKALARSNTAAKVSFGTEAGLFQEAGIPTIVCGPGSIEQAHKPNEFVTLSQIAECEAFLRRLLERLRAD